MKGGPGIYCLICGHDVLNCEAGFVAKHDGEHPVGLCQGCRPKPEDLDEFEVARSIRARKTTNKVAQEILGENLKLAMQLGKAKKLYVEYCMADPSFRQSEKVAGKLFEKEIKV